MLSFTHTEKFCNWEWWWILTRHCGNHFKTYTNIKSLCCNLKLIYCFMSIISQFKGKKSGQNQTPNNTKSHRGNRATRTYILCHCECIMIRLFEHNLVVSYKTNILNIWPSDCIPWCWLKRHHHMKTYSLQYILNMVVYNSFIHNY